MAIKLSMQNARQDTASWRRLVIGLTLAVVVAALGAALVMPGCSTPRAGRLPASAGSNAEFDAGFTLLHQLLASEARVDGILMLKSAGPGTELLLKDIAEACVEMRDQLDDMAHADPTLTREASGLPMIESVARDGIASDTTLALLGADSQDFEFLMLLSQEKAMSYGRHLAQSLAASDPNPERAEAFKVMASRMAGFHKRVMDSLIARCAPA
ncbi:MAG: hypothetical protein VX527_09590 [Planctomycetota bacterium]|nr:hypothetical protein [Planctomycetota bacterium]